MPHEARFPELGLGVSPESFRIVRRSPDRVEFEFEAASGGEGIAGYIEATFLRVCMLVGGPKDAPKLSGLPCQGTMTDIHSYVPLEANQFVFKRDDEVAGELRSVTPAVVQGRERELDGAGQADHDGDEAVVVTLTDPLQQALEQTGKPAGMVQLINNNYGVKAEQQPRRTDRGHHGSYPKVAAEGPFLPVSQDGQLCRPSQLLHAHSTVMGTETFIKNSDKARYFNCNACSLDKPNWFASNCWALIMILDRTQTAVLPPSIKNAPAARSQTAV